MYYKLFEPYLSIVKTQPQVTRVITIEALLYISNSHKILERKAPFRIARHEIRSSSIRRSRRNTTDGKRTSHTTIHRYPTECNQSIKQFLNNNMVVPEIFSVFYFVQHSWK